MFKKTLEKLSDKQLKKRNKTCLIVAVGMLFLMCIVLGISLYQTSKGNDGVFLPLVVPVILGPLTFVPIIASVLIGSELKRRRGA